MNAFILYDGLPIKSGGAHHLSKQSATAVYESVKTFLTLYADNDRPTEVHVVMRAFQVSSFFRNCLRFGFPTFNWLNYWAVKEDLVHWKLFTKNLTEKIKVVLEDENLVIGMSWQFKFVDPITGETLKGQDNFPVIDERRPKTGMYLRLSNKKNTMSVWFAFPFEELSPGNINYIKGLQDHLPFKFSVSNWRIYSYSKNGNWFSRKIAPTL